MRRVCSRHSLVLCPAVESACKTARRTASSDLQHQLGSRFSFYLSLFFLMGDSFQRAPSTWRASRWLIPRLCVDPAASSQHVRKPEQCQAKRTPGRGLLMFRQKLLYELLRSNNGSFECPLASKRLRQARSLEDVTKRTALTCSSKCVSMFGRCLRGHRNTSVYSFLTSP
jgi:hypothetical protein